MTIVSSVKRPVSELMGGDLERQLRITLAELYGLWGEADGGYFGWLAACRRGLNYKPGQQKLERSKQRENALRLLNWAEEELRIRQQGEKIA